MTRRMKVPMAGLVVSLAALTLLPSCIKRPLPLTVDQDRERVLKSLGNTPQPALIPEAQKAANSLRARALISTRDKGALSSRIEAAQKDQKRRKEYATAMRQVMPALRPNDPSYAEPTAEMIDEAIASTVTLDYLDGVRKEIRAPADALASADGWKIESLRCFDGGCTWDQEYPSPEAIERMAEDMFHDPPGMWTDWSGVMYRSGAFKKDARAPHWMVTWVLFNAKSKKERSQ